MISTIKEVFFLLFRMHPCSFCSFCTLLNKHGVIAEVICNYYLNFAYFISMSSLDHIILTFLPTLTKCTQHELKIPHWSNWLSLIFPIRIPAISGTEPWIGSWWESLPATKTVLTLYPSQYCIVSLCSPVLVHRSLCSNLFGLLCFLSPKEIKKIYIHFTIGEHFLHTHYSCCF